ncbi:MAG: ATP F0F1 synthase subunit B [Hyphomicrobiales bacterium]|nr:ATP F0F1 synthase subunit B [Hyphomicrobiales bacterium]
MPHLFADPEFWVAVAFVVFLGFAAWLGAFKALVNALDERGSRIAGELAEAKRLREEAQALLASYEKRRQEAESEAEAIIAQAKVDAERLAKEAQEKLGDFVSRRQKTAEQKIAQAEAEAMTEVRDAAAEAAIRASETILRKRSKGEKGLGLLTKSLDEVMSKLN